MKRLNFNIDINAPAEKVWNALWEDSNYRKWAAEFYEGSYAVSDWNQGSEIHFLSPEGEGMFSMIAEKRPNEYMSFKHLGVMKDGKKVEPDAETESWSGAMENYILEERGGVTTLSVELDTTEDHADYFSKAFPKALERVKEIAEG